MYRHSCKNRVIILIFMLIPATLHPHDLTFKDYLKIFPYPEIMKNITDFEMKEMNRVRVSGKGVIYPSRIIRLYLLASGITDEMKMESYIKKYNQLLKEAERKIKYNTNINRLNRYNRAEFLLHFLHSRLFKYLQEGREAGYNIGIKETFDSGKFNCYKSALLFNAFLQNFNYSSHYISAPEHVYSSIRVNGRDIDVETTNRYGFDPYNRGSPGYRRLFDKKNIKFLPKNYSYRKSMDNFTILVQVYNNRSLLYSGDMTYRGISVTKNYGRAAALSIIGSYLNYNNENYITDNTLYKIFQVSREILSLDPERLAHEYSRYVRVLNSNIFKKNSAKHLYNLEISFSRAIPEIRNISLKKIKKEDTKKIIEIFIEECRRAARYIKANRLILEGVWNNSILKYTSIMKKRFPVYSMSNIKEYSRNILKFISTGPFKRNGFINKYRSQFKNNVCIFIDNLGIKSLNSRNWKTAHSIYTDGIDFLRNEINVIDGYYYRQIIDHHKYAKKFLK